jgi:hypothetical protein
MCIIDVATNDAHSIFVAISQVRISSATHNRSMHIMQSVFSLASPQIRRAACRELTGDAELKMDWTEPPTELNAMGFYSGGLVFGDGQIARVDGWLGDVGGGSNAMK